MNLQAKNLIDYFVVCGLDVNGSGLEPEPNEIYHSKCFLTTLFLLFDGR